MLCTEETSLDAVLSKNENVFRFASENGRKGIFFLKSFPRKKTLLFTDNTRFHHSSTQLLQSPIFPNQQN